MKDVNRYKDLERRGYGSRWTVDRNVKQGKFPAPHVDPNGRPFWTDEQLKEWLDSQPQPAA